jgi:hypothetical protein
MRGTIQVALMHLLITGGAVEVTLLQLLLVRGIVEITLMHLLIMGGTVEATLMHFRLWDMTPCGSCKNRPFVRKYHLYHRREKKQRARNNVEEWCLL